MSNKPNAISHVVKLKQMIKRWRIKAKESSSSSSSAVVPPGHVAVCVGPARRRYVVRATYLNHPEIQSLLARAEEEFGFPDLGPIAIPNCDEHTFDDVLRAVSTSLSPRRQGNLHHFAPGSGADSRPLLPG